MRLQSLHWHPSSPSIPLPQTQIPNSISFAVICDFSHLRGPISTTRPPLRIPGGPACPRLPPKLHLPSGPLFNSSPRSNPAFQPACSPPVAALSSRGRQRYFPPGLGPGPRFAQASARSQGVCSLTNLIRLPHLLPLPPSAHGNPQKRPGITTAHRLPCHTDKHQTTARVSRLGIVTSRSSDTYNLCLLYTSL